MADNYEKMETVGQGSFGQVYRFRRKDNGEFVAVSVPNSDTAPRSWYFATQPTFIEWKREGVEARKS